MTPTYDTYPGVDENNEFPPSIREAFAASDELRVAIADEISENPDVVDAAVAMAQAATGLIPTWKSNTTYAAGQKVFSPTGDIVQAKVNFTSGTTYSAANWTVVNTSKTVPNGTNWDTILEIGLYRLDSFTNSNTMSNLPPTPNGFAGVIEVLPITATRVIQRGTEYATTSPGKVWIRVQNINGSFPAWDTLFSKTTALLTATDLDSLLTTNRYRTETSTIATSLINAPAGIINPIFLDVIQLSVVNGVSLQTLIEYGPYGPIISQRFSVSNVFQPWSINAPASRNTVEAGGDSLTEGGGLNETWSTSDPWPARAASVLSGVTITNKGRSGDTTDEILLRLGIHFPHFSVSGGSIPASGAVAVSTNMQLFIPRNRNYSGSLAGVSGTLAYTFSSNTWTFTRSASGSVVSVTGLVRFISSQTWNPSNPLVFWGGRNDYGFVVSGLDGSMTNHIVANHRKVFVTSKYPDRVLFLGPTLNTNEKVGTAGYTNVWNAVNQLKYLYPGTFYSVLDYLIDKALDDANIVKTAADITAISNREVPPSLFITGDTTHFKKEIADVIGRLFVAPLLKAKGWVL
ncbi:tail protein [Arthrobacter phage Kardesai]|uniref:Minor tail protein n=1 Tax=Arthrobacter phage Kardesai TaxID=2859474 RepID=A0AAE7VHK8_9CAUD|nr:tail protein [Arthrobacter phage Kardesai]QXO12924.1 hypothetical protein SEA_KARDESAI_17 [Arthrobacter phage Kardesai]